MKRAADGRWGIRAVLTGALVGSMFASTGAMIYLAFHHFEDLAGQAAQRALAQQARAGADALQALVAQAAALAGAEACRPLPRRALDEMGRRALQQRWTTLLAGSPGVVALEIGLDGGERFQLMPAWQGGAGGELPELDKLGEGRWVIRQTLPAAGEASLAASVKSMPQVPQVPVVTRWRVLDAGGNVLSQRSLPDAADLAPVFTASASLLAASAGDGMAAGCKGGAAPMQVSFNRTQDGAKLAVSGRLAEGGGTVVALVDLRGLDRAFAQAGATTHAVSALVDPAGRLAAWGGGPEAPWPIGLSSMSPLAQSGDVVLASMPAGDAVPTAVWRPEVAGVAYAHVEKVVALAPGQAFRIVAYAPSSDFAAADDGSRRWMAIAAMLFLLAGSALAWFGARRIASRLADLAADARRITPTDLAQTETPPVRSRLREIDALGAAQAAMKHSVRTGTEALRASQQRLEDLITAGLNMSRERNMMGLLEQMIWGARQLTHCDAVTLYIVTEQRTLRFALRTRADALPVKEIPLHDPSGRENTQFVSAFVALRNQPVVIDDVYQEDRFDLSGTRGFDATSGYRTVSMLALPLAPREGEVIGVLQLMNALDPVTGQVVPFDEEAVRLASALAAQAAVSLDNHQLVQAQQDLVDSMVRLIAGAIDAKSPYTGGHCERVPELALMLAEEASNATTGPLASFRFETPEEWREFRVGAWLHDCGKMTTPEYVVDKATKLETIYDRIHEIRTRYEVLWRDAEIDCLQACIDGQDAATAVRRRDRRHATLQTDFAFVAECNLGAEYMAQDRVARLRRIGGQTWLRHFDDRLGISHGAQARLKDVSSVALPAVEKLLDDKPEHLVERPPSAAPDPRHGFKMDVPEHLYHHGELHNLSVSRGTLTPEERYKVNEHITQTIVMLDAMPFPKNLRRVPEYAGTHHETLTGKGYPRRLDASQLSVPARIMAVADIFEALTAADRPYKKSKTLSEAIEILYGFKQRGHIDSDVFDLFLTSGVYLRYAQRFLTPELIDAVDIEPYLGATTWTSRRHTSKRVRTA
ncbi:MAG: diguanylate cyclase [Rhodoferax sp.]|nr:diguanylate cyclase [Rhodoferax sp.]